MAQRKKHLRYHAKKQATELSQHITPQADEVLLVQREESSKSSTVVKSQRTVSKVSKGSSKAAYTLLSDAEQAAIRAELWHIVRVALIMVVLYFILWLGFRFWNWEAALEGLLSLPAR